MPSVTVAAPPDDLNGSDTMPPTNSTTLTVELSTIAGMLAATRAPPAATPARAA
jgi:hypothetical protein